jgi:hypothetical protein
LKSTVNIATARDRMDGRVKPGHDEAARLTTIKIFALAY